MNIKTNLKSFIFLLLSVAVIMLNPSCNKYLEEKPSKNLKTIASLQDAQALLDNYVFLNQRDLGAGEVSADDYYLTEDSYSQIEENFKRMYTWEKDFLFVPEFNDWGNLYSTIYLPNSALGGLPKINRTSANAQSWDNVKGQALFFRSWFLLQGLVIWAPAYDPSTAGSDPGIPLRLNTNFNEVSVRASVKDGYERIIGDLKEAVTLLPNTQQGLTRPSRTAALALLARIALLMGDYANAGQYAAEALSLHSELIDFSTLNLSDEYPIPPLNREIIYESYLYVPTPLANFYAAIDPELYQSYEENDLRREIFFNPNADGSYGFYGSYEGSLLPFTGISTNELYLIKAEVAARSGNTNDALKVLDGLLTKRWAKDPKSGQSLYLPKQASNSKDALMVILQERRKELLMRGLRWPDIKRLNKEGYQISLKRTLGNRIITLPPGDLRYQLPIPEDVISQTGMAQNPK